MKKLKKKDYLVIVAVCLLLISCASGNNTKSEKSEDSQTISAVSTETSVSVETVSNEIETPISEKTVIEEDASSAPAEIMDEEIESLLSEETVIEEKETYTETAEIVSIDLNGRGYSDSGRSEPQYENITGYVAVYDSYPLEQNDTFTETPWTIPIYEYDNQSWVECGVVDHKTKVRVISQQLEHNGYGVYSGYLLVERLEDNEQFYISVKNFITKPYWTYDDLEMAASVGCSVAEFNHASDYYPVDKKNSKVELDDGVKVLIVGKTGTYGRGGPDRNTNSIEAIVFKEWKYGYGGVSVFFNQEDLTIIY